MGRAESSHKDAADEDEIDRLKGARKSGEWAAGAMAAGHSRPQDCDRRSASAARPWWPPEVKRMTALQFEALGVSIMLSDLDKRLTLVQGELEAAAAAAMQRYTPETIRQSELQDWQSKVQEAEERAKGAEEAKESTERDREEACQAKNELYQTCQKLIKQLQAEQRQVQTLDKERERAKLKESGLKSANDELSTKLTRAQNDNQLLAKVNNDLAAEVKMQIMAQAASAEITQELKEELEEFRAATVLDGAKIESLESRLREMESKADMKNEELRLANEGIKRRELELKDLKVLMQEEQSVLQQELHRAQAQLEQARRELADTGQIAACLECANSKEELAQMHAASFRAEVAAEAALARFRISEARYQDLLVHSKAVQSLGAGEGKQMQRAAHGGEDADKHAERVRELSEALRAAEEEINALTETISDLTMERDQHTHAWRDISGEVNRLRAQIVLLTGDGECSNPQSLGREAVDGGALNGGLGANHRAVRQEIASSPRRRDLSGLRGTGDKRDQTCLSEPGWCSADKDFSHVGRDGRIEADSRPRHGADPRSDPLDLFQSFPFVDANFPFPWNHGQKVPPSRQDKSGMGEGRVLQSATNCRPTDPGRSSPPLD